MSTHRAWLRLSLLDDVVVSADAATTGGHRSLSGLPGSAILGAAASGLYRRWSLDGQTKDWGWLAFQSGLLRFGDAVPLTTQGPAYPLPLSLHAVRGREEAVLLNLVHQKRPERQQLEQVRGGAIACSADGAFRAPGVRKSQRLRTAISPETGRAADGQLFGYEAIARGQIFVAPLEADEGASGPWGVVLDFFRDAKVISLGRSRNAEYGRVRIEVLPEDAYGYPSCSAPTPGGACVVWAISDLALTDHLGRPSLTPLPSAFGLPDGRYDPEISFLRHRSYWPWNSALGGRVLVRNVVEAGSVLVFLAGPSGQMPSPGAMRLGLYQEQGLGRVLVSPTLLGLSDLRLSPVAAAANRDDAQEVADDDFAIWLDRRVGGDETAARKAEELLLELKSLYEKAGELRGRKVNEAGGPSASQWGEVRRAAEEAGSAAALAERLLHGEQALARPTDLAWGGRMVILSDGRTGTFREWLQKVVTDHGQEKQGRDAIARLARAAGAWVKQTRDKRRVG